MSPEDDGRERIRSLLLFTYMEKSALISTLTEKVNRLIEAEKDLFLVEIRIKPTNNIQTNIFVSVRIWINGIEKRKLITDDDIDSPDDKGGEFISPLKNMSLTVVKLNLLERLLDGVFKT